MKFGYLLLCLIPCAVASAFLERLIFRVKGNWISLLAENYVFSFVNYYAVHLLTMDKPIPVLRELLLTVPITTVALGLVLILIKKINDSINSI